MLSKDDLQRLKETNACPEGNLSEVVMVGANLEGANLFIAVLKEPTPGKIILLIFSKSSLDLIIIFFIFSLS